MRQSVADVMNAAIICAFVRFLVIIYVFKGVTYAYTSYIWLGFDRRTLAL